MPLGSSADFKTPLGPHETFSLRACPHPTCFLVEGFGSRWYPGLEREAGPLGGRLRPGYERFRAELLGRLIV
jgi:hypothetical protein